MSRRLLAAVATGVALLATASPAAAYELDETKIPWPYDTITYADRSDHPFSVNAAVRGWNAADTGYRFVRASSVERANVVFFSDPTRRDDECSGRALQGYNLGQSFVALDGRCDRYLMTLGAAHEIGHLLTLEHEDSECAVMNAGAYVGRGSPRLARPVRCGRREHWRRPVLADDRAGARAAHALPYRFPASLCRPEGEPSSEAIRSELLCQRQYDCHGRSGTAPVVTAEPAAFAPDPNTGRPRYLEGCRESAWAVAARARSAIARWGIGDAGWSRREHFARLEE